MNYYNALINLLCKVVFSKRRFLQYPNSTNTDRSSVHICFALTVCDEYEELGYLLDSIIPHKREGDEILIQGDSANISDKVRSVISSYSSHIDTFIEFPLNGDFGAFKNNLSKHTKCPYIFQLDADEIPSSYLLENLHGILSLNPDVELIRVPRLNIMIDNDKPFLMWKDVPDIKDSELVNFPDFQRRIYKNMDHIYWIKKIHEKIYGNKTISYLPKDRKYCILHCKHWIKQLKWSAYKNIDKNSL